MGKDIKMAYFSNGSEGMCFDIQCMQCKYGDKPCPIALVQYIYNYDACNNEVASKILNELVKGGGTCTMFERFESDLRIATEEEVSTGWKLYSGDGEEVKDIEAEVKKVFKALHP